MASAPVWDSHLTAWITSNYPDRKTRILDVGAGHGKYGKLLREYYETIDAIELWDEHIEKLKVIYNKIYKVNAMEFKFMNNVSTSEASTGQNSTDNHYDLVILGDMLEHLELKDAQALLTKIEQSNPKNIIITIPYEYPQHTLYGNVLEIHLQPDLTPENMKTRYPKYNVLFSYYNKANPGFKGIGVYTLMKNEKTIIIHPEVAQNVYHGVAGGVKK